MIIDFNQLQEKAYKNFKGGSQDFQAMIYDDTLNKLIHGRLEKGASIGMHTHSTNSEIIYILQGTGTLIYDGNAETVSTGMCHYCPKGHTHSLMNQSDEDLIFFAVIPEQ